MIYHAKFIADFFKWIRKSTTTDELIEECMSRASSYLKFLHLDHIIGHKKQKLNFQILS